VNGNSITALLLFTDGEPNRNPPMGIVAALETTLRDIQVRFTISSFGFGYNIDSPLMEEIAQVGNGVYGYCPDCTMVGTVFINYMANLLSTLEQNATLTVQAPNSVNTQLLALPNGGSRNVLVRLPSSEIQRTQVTLFVAGQAITSAPVSPVGRDQAQIVNQIYRAKLMSLIKENLARPAPDVRDRIRRLYDEIRGLPSKTPFLNNILTDLIHPDANHGQVELAFHAEYFPKWGNHYLRSLLRFHAVEQCGNFKDQSLQLYATPQFTAMQTIAHKLFISLPPPQTRAPQGRIPTTGYGFPIETRQGRRPALAMARLYSASGPCFGGDCWVDLKHGRKMIRDLQKGDLLVDGGVVECVVETVMPPGAVSDLCLIGRAVITPYHPIQVEGEWVFPCSVAPITNECVDSWYNLVLQRNKVVRVEGVKAITLAHGMTQGVLAHPYFGTNAVVEALKKYPGYAQGYVRAPMPVNIVRNDEGMIISAF
jgi:hypothetical protein